MNINFRTIQNSADEIYMGQKLWFKPVEGCDVISATANAPGFTTLIAIARHFGWDYDMLAFASEACNNKGEVLTLTTVTPNLILVPATKGRSNTRRLMFDFIMALGQIEGQRLHFTHFGFLQGQFPKAEVSEILNYFLGLVLPSTLEMVVFDIDIRRQKQLYGLMQPNLPDDER